MEVAWLATKQEAVSSPDHTNKLPARSTMNLQKKRTKPVSLRSKRFRGVWKQRKTEERDFRCFVCAEYEARTKKKKERGGRGLLTPFFALWYSLLPETLATQARNQCADILVPIALFVSLSPRGLGTRIVFFVPRPRRLRGAKRAMGTRMVCWPSTLRSLMKYL